MRLGDAEVDRAIEWVGPVLSVADLFPNVPRAAWDDVSDETAPSDELRWRGVMQTWIVRTGGMLVLIDTGVGNDRDRPQAPTFSGLRTGFLDDLRAAGVAPDDVDVVVDTHIHYDHVGWNTRLTGDGWVPTFPHARYLIPRADAEYFDPVNAAAMRPARTADEKRRFEGSRLVFADSIAPVLASGQAVLWSGTYDVGGGLTLEQVGGHTPGSSVAWLGTDAVFVGDLLHSTVQLARPDVGPIFDLDADAASTAREAVLARAAREHRWVFPAHLAGSGGFRIRTAGEGFEVAEWAPLPHV